MTIEIFDLIGNIQILFFAIGAILSFIRYRAKRFEIILLGLVLATSVICDLVSSILINFNFRQGMNYVSSAYSVIVFPLVACLYFYSIGKKHLKIFIYIVSFFEMFTLVNMFFIQKGEINSYTMILQSIFTISLSLYYFYWLLKELPADRLQNLPMFWINGAFLSFHSANLFLFVFTSYLVNVLNNNLLTYWSIHNAFGIMEGVILILALYVDLRQVKHSL